MSSSLINCSGGALVRLLSSFMLLLLCCGCSRVAVSPCVVDVTREPNRFVDISPDIRVRLGIDLVRLKDAGTERFGLAVMLENDPSSEGALWANTRMTYPQRAGGELDINISRDGEELVPDICSRNPGPVEPYHYLAMLPGDGVRRIVPLDCYDITPGVYKISVVYQDHSRRQMPPPDLTVLNQAIRSPVLTLKVK